MKKLDALFKLFRCFKKEQCIVFALCLINIILSLFIPFLIKVLIDNITAKAPFNIIFGVCLKIIIVTLISVAANIIQNFFWHNLRVKSVNYLRYKMFESALNKSVKYIKQNKIGEMLAKIMDDAVGVAQNISIGFPMLILNMIRVFIVIGVLLLLDAKLSILPILTVPIYYLMINKINRNLRAVSGLERQKFSNVMKDANEKILGIKTIKIFSKNDFMLNKFHIVLNEHLDSTRTIIYYGAVGIGVNKLIMSLLPIFILSYGSYLTYQNQLSLGSLIAFYTYMAYIYEPIKNLSDFNLEYQKTIGMCDRVTNFLFGDLDYDDCTGEIDEFEYIEFKNVSFRYNNNSDDYVLKNVSFRIDKGDRIAVMGMSGCGKSTILNLIMKMYSSYEGDIIINGKDLKSIKKQSLYKNLVLLEQEPFIFNGTIRENITLSNTVDEASIKTAVKTAQIEKLISSYSEGLDYTISELGSNLSGGEKQRICLCRTLVKDSELIILDEATSAVDEGIESEILKELTSNYLSKGKTLIAVSHRPSILQICNKIIKLDSRGIIIQEIEQI